MPRGTEIVFERLKAAAAEPRLVTYEELMDGTGVPERAAGSRLNYIHGRLAEQSPGRPWLVAIAVRKNAERRDGPRMPGKGLFRGADFKLDLRDPDQRAWWRAMVLHVFATDWSGVEL